MDDDTRKRVALHDISVKVHLANLDQEYGLPTPKHSDRAESLTNPAMRRSRSWGDNLHLAGSAHSIHGSLGMRLQSSTQQAGFDDIIKVTIPHHPVCRHQLMLRTSTVKHD